MARPPVDADSPWKEGLDRYLRECLALFLPEAHADIDWSRPPEFLDTELRQAARGGSTGVRRVDRLVRVWLLDGSDTWVLIHVEVQAQAERGFAERMYVYHCRIFDRHRREVVSLATPARGYPADEREDWRPGVYASGRWGCSRRFEYPVVKLLDWRERQAELEAGDNPFAALVLAHLAAQETRKDAGARTQAKLGLIRRLCERGYDRERIIDLFRLTDWPGTRLRVLLPAAAEAEVWREVERIEEERKMPYVTSVERIGLARGLEQGRQEGRVEGKRATLLRLVQGRFGSLPPALDERIAAGDEVVLDEMIDRVVVAARIEDL